MEFNRKQFKNEEIRLDGNTFLGCSFDNCMMVYGGGPPPSMIDCSLNGVKWSFTEAASNTIQFMSAIYHGMGEGGKKVIEETFTNIRKNMPKK